MCKAGTVGKISDYQPEGPRFNSQLGQGLDFGILSVDGDVKCWCVSQRSTGELKQPTYLSIHIMYKHVLSIDL